MDKTNKIILATCIVIIISYLGFLYSRAYSPMSPVSPEIRNCSNITEKDLNDSYLKGAEYGYSFLQAKIIQDAFNCSAQPIMVQYKNYTASLVAAECLNMSKVIGE